MTRTEQITVSKTNWQDLALPVVLLITGIILLGGDWIGLLSLDRIQNLWPVSFILVGLIELGPVAQKRTGDF